MKHIGIILGAIIVGFSVSFIVRKLGGDAWVQGYLCGASLVTTIVILMIIESKEFKC